ncbi:hypothetical protein [Xenorhabdus kozodoii]|uniref:Uncharacterized protein n=1 Tax=Xenorhabdus kozodoii TaxID=351676 RepID=A0A2D0LHP2_9GAMM|nr:hypothetical protein [Xenorhabdus kozodoii]PHM75228.1 hypothetical protein Xkoz_00244 [Xenorhabdus kozodoii]
MLIENILRNVIRKTQSVFMGGSNNKIYFKTKNIDKVGEHEPPEVHDLTKLLKKKTELLDKLRENQNKMKNIPQCYTYYTKNKFKTNLVGNCDELSTYAFHYLIKNHSLQIFNYYRQQDPDRKKIIYIIMYGAQKPYDHVFLSIHYMEDKISKKEIIEALSHVQAESWICDPWADIICKGKEFHYKWRSKMTDWYHANIFRTPNSDDRTINDTGRYESLFSPLRPEVFNTIQENSTYDVLELAFFDQDGNITTLAKNEKIMPYDISNIDNSVFTSLGVLNMDE